MTALLAGITVPAMSRTWKPTPLQAAQDYLTIEHGISDYEHVVVFWYAPEFFGNDPGSAEIRKITQDYLMVALMHFKVDDLGRFEVFVPEAVSVESDGSEPLTQIPASELPPVTSALVDVMTKTVAGGMGKVGSGMRMFLFDGSSVNSCREGVLSITFNEESYTFETPLPGCK